MWTPQNQTKHSRTKVLRELPGCAYSLGKAFPVAFLVLREGRSVSEELATPTALQRLFFGVDPLVLLQQPFVEEGLLTVTALERPFLAMQFLVHGQSGSVSVKLPTFAALQRFRSGVDPLVLQKGSFVEESLPTVTALERPFPAVQLLMFSEGGCVSKPLATFTARMRLVSGVDPPVLQKPFLQNRFATVTTHEPSGRRERGRTIPSASLRMLSVVGGLMPKSHRASQAILLIFTPRRVTTGHEDAEATERQGPLLLLSLTFLPTVPFLMGLEVGTERNRVPTRHSDREILHRMHSY